MTEDILNIVKRNEEWRERQCLNLIPSENIMSPSARGLLSCDFAHRYTSVDHYYMGTRYTDKIQEYGEKLARDIFKCEVADLRPLSGHIADLIVLANLTKQGETFMCVSPTNGGYPGLWNDALAGILSRRAVGFPYSKKDMNIIVEKGKAAIRKVKPKLIVFGASLITFPHPVKELSEAASEYDTMVGFDGSHVLGLIGGGQFQSPLQEGAHVLFGSTHKSLFGPQGGMILATREVGEMLKDRVFPGFVDNAHWNRIAALTMTLAEMKRFGRAYAAQIVCNSKALAKSLSDLGFPVVCSHLGFTKSHQTILDYGTVEKAKDVAERLQRANIIVDRVIRLGTCEVTRRGMKEAEMVRVAELLKRTIVDKEDPQNIRKEVAKLGQEFEKIEYCFDT